MIKRYVARLVTVEEGEWRATLLAFAFFFCLLSSYFILRSIRDALGVQAGVGTLPYLFTGTLLCTLALQPLSAALVSRVPVRTFIPIIYRIFGACLLFFSASLTWWVNSDKWLAPMFFVWTSVFNLFVVTVFWGFISDTFRSEQSKRLYGFISVGGTLGGIVGSLITAALAKQVTTAVLMLMSFVLLECAVQCVRIFPPSFRPETREREAKHETVGGGAFAGITHALRSPYMLGIGLFMMLFTIGTTVLYFQQAEIVKREFADRGSRTAFLATIDLTVQGLTVLAQLFLTGRIIKWVGVGITLAILPVMSVIGFTTLALIPSSLALSAFVVFQVLRRAGNYGFSSPGREVLFTVLSPEDKYKAKNFIDTFVYRSGDQIGAWSYAGLAAAGVAISSISLMAVPLSAVWFFVALWLGRRHTQMQAAETATTAALLAADGHRVDAHKAVVLPRTADA